MRYSDVSWGERGVGISVLAALKTNDVGSSQLLKQRGKSPFGPYLFHFFEDEHLHCCTL